MSFAQRLVVGTVVILILTVLILLWGAERSLRRDLAGDVARGLEREGRLIREAIPADSLGWDEAVHGRLAKKMRDEQTYRYRLFTYAALGE